MSLLHLLATLELVFAGVHLYAHAPALALWSSALGLVFLGLARLRGDA